MLVMTDITDSHPDELLPDGPSSQDSNGPWSTEGNVDDHLADSSSFTHDDMPVLEDYSPYASSAHYTSPVASSYTELEPGEGFRDPYECKEPGVAGLQNLGNTCFMNAGLQCLFNNSAVTKYFLESFEQTEHILHTLTGQYAALLKQVWSGKHAVIRPHTFKEVLGSYYPQFKDFRQHDCQEFLALLLDSFHEQLNEYKCDGVVMESEDEDAAVMEDCCDPSLPNNMHCDQSMPNNMQNCDQALPNNMLYTSDSHNNLYKSESKNLEVHNTQSCNDLILNNSERCAKRRIMSDSAVVSSSSMVYPSSSTRLIRRRREEVTSTKVTREEESRAREASSMLEHADTEQDVHAARDCVEVDSQSSLSNCLSEDSNLSESSTETVQSEDLRRRLLAIPQCLKSQAEHEESMDTDTGPADSTSQCPGSSITTKQMPTLEDFYKKDTKIQNTNVLASDFENEVTTDSSKFHKHDNNDRPAETYEQLSGFLLNEVKGGAAKAVKDTNLLANMKEKFSEGLEKKCLWGESSSKEAVQEADCNINNIKRIKIDEEEKNIRMQARLKMNTNKAIITEGKSSEPNMVIGEASWHGNIAMVTGMQEQQLQQRDITAADKAWRRYLARNRSVIVDNFQGQFKSTVICAECNHVSVTYEPFMYLSVPLPHAMERQFSIIYIACDSRQPVRYLVTVDKQGAIFNLKNKLRALVGEDANNIVMAEVFQNHIARILDDNMLLRFINTSERMLYGFEMLPAPPVENDSDSILPLADVTPVVPNNSTVNNATCPQNNDVFNNIGTFSCEELQITNNQKPPVAESKELEPTQIVNNLGEAWSHSWLEGTGFVSEVDWVQADSTTDPVSSAQAWTSGDANTSEVSTSQWQDSSETEKGETGDKTPQEEVTVDQWRSCAICLEEMADSELMIHTSCGGTLCQSCLDMSFKHYGDDSLICPVCSCAIDPAEDFIQLSAMADYQPKTRILCIPVLYRLDYEESGESQMKLFGHPNLLYMPSHMTGDFLYQSVDRVVPFLANYSILLTDGQGYHCSRCLYTSHCSGCEIDRESPEVFVQPGDHLAVRFNNISTDQQEQADSFRDHVSMMLQRSNDPLSLLDCFSAFTDSEVLDEHNPWYCPQCQRNCCAHKTITVWRYPNTLVVYLKRFVFHELSSTKIDSKVVYPLENLDLSGFISGPAQGQLTYDLHACVCHSGGVNAGHYTGYAKHPQTEDWHYFNDEMATRKQPDESDYSSTYVLFYQKQGTSVDFNLPCGEIEECDSATDISDKQLLPPGGSTSNQQLNDKIQQLLIHLQEGSQTGQEKSQDNVKVTGSEAKVTGSVVKVIGSDVNVTCSEAKVTGSEQSLKVGDQDTQTSEEPDSTLDFYS